MLRRTRKRLQEGLQWLWEQEGTPGQRARGLAAGIFCGCFPIFGLQTLAGITLASVVRGNHLLAAAGTWISNPFTYVPLYWFNYRIRGFVFGPRKSMVRSGEPAPGGLRCHGMECAQPLAAGVQHHRCHLCSTGLVAEPAMAAAATTQLLTGNEMAISCRSCVRCRSHRPSSGSDPSSAAVAQHRRARGGDRYEPAGHDWSSRAHH